MQTVSREIYRDDSIQVQLLEQRDPSGTTLAKGFEHPWEVDLETLDALLQSIQYQRGILINRNKAREVFPQALRQNLLVPLQKAFAEAGPDQAVDFSFLDQGTWLIFQRQYLTDGLLFRKGGKFNCALRNLAFQTLGGPDEGASPCTADPTEKPLRGDWSFVTQEGQRLAPSDSSGLFGKPEFPNWVQVDLARTWTSGQSTETPKGEAPEPLVTAPEVQPAPAEPGPPAVQPVPVEPAPPPVSPSELEERLRFLDELHREGSLSDEAYEQKKKELLER